MSKAVQGTSLHQTKANDTHDTGPQTTESENQVSFGGVGGLAEPQGVASQLQRTMQAGAGGREAAQRSFGGLGRQGYSNQQLGRIARLVASSAATSLQRISTNTAPAAVASTANTTIPNPTNISQFGIGFIHKWEQLRLQAYLDAVGIWTIGWGHTGSDVTPGLTITKEKADALFAQDIVRFENSVRNNVKVPINQNQFDALTSFCYNEGEDSLNPANPDYNDLINYINSVKDGNFNSDEIHKQFHKYRFAAGQELPGLATRRQEEADMFMSGSTATTGNNPPSGSTGTSSNIYTIKSGDTLSGIAKNFGITPDDILAIPANQDINTLDGKGVTWITIQTYPEPGNNGQVVHKVESGDTLTDLARHYRTSVAAILTLTINSDVDTNCLHNADDKVTLPQSANNPTGGQTGSGSEPGSSNPGGSSSGQVPGGEPGPSGNPSQTGNGIIYTIRPGDTMSGIAKRAGVTPDAILNLSINQDINSLDSKGVDYISVPGSEGGNNPYYKVESGDTLTGFAQRYGTSVAAILGLPVNSDVDANCLHNADHKITLPAGATDPNAAGGQPDQGNQGGQAGDPTKQPGGQPVSGDVVHLNIAVTEVNRYYYKSLSKPSHPLPNDYMSRIDASDSHDPFRGSGQQCVWYTNEVLHQIFDNDITATDTHYWGNQSGAPNYTGSPNIGDARNWPFLAKHAKGGVVSVTKTPTIGSFITWQTGTNGHIAVVEDLRMAVDSQNRPVVIISISEYNQNEHEEPQYRDMLYPASTPGVAEIPDYNHFIQFSQGYHGRK